ncbi:MAG: glycosyltransferase [Candidatus Woesebacteria bacterium]|nr:glycosyltransferase [Candidatus Woesebacteria bacterium]
MKLAFLTSNRDPSIPLIDNDGQPITVRNYTYWLSKFGHHIDIYSYKVIPDKISNNYFKRKFVLQKDKKVKLFPNVNVIRIDVPSQTTKDLFSSIDLRDMPEIIQSLVASEYFKDNLLFEYDTICMFHPLASFGVVFRNFIPLNKAVLFPMLLSDEYIKFKSVSLIYIQLEQLVLNSVAKIFSTSSDEKNTLRLRGIKNNKIEVLPRGIDVDIFKHVQKTISNNPKILRLITVGSIRPQKRQSILIEVVNQLLLNGLDVHLSIIGEKDNFTMDVYKKYYNDMKKEISNKKLYKNIEFEGAVCQQRLSKFYENSDIAIFPSISESFGKSVIESISSGTPTIIAKECKAYCDFAEDGVNSIFSGSNVEEITKSILMLINNPKLYMKISENGEFIKEGYGWEVVTRKLEKELVKLLESNQKS